MLRNISRLHLLSFFLLTALVLFISGCDDSSSEPQGSIPGSVIYVANYGGGAGNISTISHIDDVVSNGVAGVGDTPNHMFIRDDMLYVLNSGSNNMNIFEIADDNVLTLVDTLDLGVEQNNSPQFADVTENGKMFVSNFENNTVTIYDLNTDQVLAYVPVGVAPGFVKVVGEKVYVCNSAFDSNNFSYGQGTVSVINTTSNLVETTINVATNPQFMDVDPLGRLHVVCTGNYNDIMGQIVVVDTAADTIKQYIAIGGKPQHLTIKDDGMGYLTASGGFNDGDPGYVFKYNTSSGQIIYGPNNPIEVPNGATRTLLGPSNEIFVSCYGADQVVKIDGDIVTQTYNVGDGPTSMAVVVR